MQTAARENVRASCSPRRAPRHCTSATEISSYRAATSAASASTAAPASAATPAAARVAVGCQKKAESCRSLVSQRASSAWWCRQSFLKLISSRRTYHWPRPAELSPPAPAGADPGSKLGFKAGRTSKACSSLASASNAGSAARSAGGSGSTASSATSGAQPTWSTLKSF